MIIKITDINLAGKRIDISLPTIDKSLSRSKVQNLINKNLILVNDKLIKSSYLLKLNDEIKINLNNDIKLSKEEIPLDIVYEDDYLLVINKQRGLVVHPGNGNLSHTLVNGLLNYTNKLSHIDESRPGIVHRIDKDTSGLLVIAKDDKTHLLLTNMLKNHDIKRTYLALVKGEIAEEEGKIIAPIARDINPIKMCVNIKKGKEAETYFKVIEKNKDVTLIKAELKQGRTHQIRVHFTYINHPLIGDIVYGKENTFKIKDGQILHAYKLEFIHPITKKKMLIFTPIPSYFINALKIYNLNYKLDIKRL